MTRPGKSPVIVLYSVVILLLLQQAAAWAQGAAPRAGGWRPDSFPMAIASTTVFAILGVLIAIIGFKLFDLLTPFNLEQEICEKQNIAVAILCGAMVLGICLVVAMSVL